MKYNMSICDECDLEVPADAKRCPHCGVEYEEEEKEDFGGCVTRGCLFFIAVKVGILLLTGLLAILKIIIFG